MKRDIIELSVWGGDWGIARYTCNVMFLTLCRFLNVCCIFVVWIQLASP